MDLLKPTGLAPKGKGDSLTATEVNTINYTVNNSVTAVNTFLKEFCDVNAECSDFTKGYKAVTEAAATIPSSRRKLGLKIKYRNEAGGYNEYIFSGNSVEDSEWVNEDNWCTPITIIDGGEW